MFPSIIDILILPHAVRSRISLESLSSRESRVRWTRVASIYFFVYFLSQFAEGIVFSAICYTSVESTQLFIPRIIRTFRGNRNWIPPPRTEQLFSLWIASNWTRGTSRLTSRERGREKQRGRGRREAVGGTNKFNIGQMERRKVLETMGTGDGKGNVVAFVTRCIRCCPMGGGGRR